MDEVDLPAPVQLPQDGVPHHVVIGLRHVGLDRQPRRWWCFDDTHRPHPGQRHVQGARNRRGRQCQHVYVVAQPLQALLLLDTEPLLLVNDDQA